MYCPNLFLWIDNCESIGVLTTECDLNKGSNRILVHKNILRTTIVTIFQQDIRSLAALTIIYVSSEQEAAQTSKEQEVNNYHSNGTFREN
jgi:hypothetical protein